MRRRGSWSRARRCRRRFEISRSTTTTRRPSAATACRSRTGCAAASRPAPRRPCGAASPWPSLARRVDGGAIDASTAWRRRPRHRRDASTQNPSPHRRRRRGPRHPRNKRPRGGARRRAGARRRRPWPREFVARVRIIARPRPAARSYASMASRETHTETRHKKTTQVPAPKPRSGPPANWASTTTVAPKQKTKRPSTKMHDGPVTDFVVLDQPRVALRGPVAREIATAPTGRRQVFVWLSIGKAT